MTHSTQNRKTGFGGVTVITLTTAAAILLMPMQATPARATALGGAIGGAVLGGIMGVPIMGAMSGAIIGGAAADRKRRRKAERRYRKQMNHRYRQYDR
jgi:hypothetical protein